MKTGRMYNRGLSVERDPVEAMKWIEKAAAQDDTEAIIYLGLKKSYG